jgi:DNA-binding CsgD family transcriptional regulator
MAHHVRGFLAVLQSDPATARPALERAVTAAREAGQVSLQSQSLALASLARHTAGDRVSARRLLRNILNKLGVNSRAQIAAWVVSSDQ